MKPLHDLDQIKAHSELKLKTLNVVMNRQQQKKKYVISGFVGVFTCLCIIFAFRFLPSNSVVPSVVDNDIYAYVSVDINPSMEFQLDKDDKIVNIISYNDDAKTILEQGSFKGLTIQEMISWLLSNETIQDYMNSGYMQVSVYSDDKSHSLALEKQLDSSLSKQLKSSQYGCSCVTGEEQQAAIKHHMSFGKYQAIELILNLNNQYTLEQLEIMSMYDIKTIYEELTGNAYPQSHGNGHNNGSGKGNGHHGQQQK